MFVKMLKENDVDYRWKPNNNIIDNKSMICEFRKTLYYKQKAKKGSIILRKLSYLWLPYNIQDVDAREKRISYNKINQIKKMDIKRIKYIELKTGYNDDGPAWIGKVKFSKSGKTIYFNGLALKSCKGQGVGSNYYDLETGLEYWVSGIKKDGWNRHWAGRGKIMIEKSLYDWFKEYTNNKKTNFLEIIEDCPQTDIEKINKKENEKI